MNRADFIATPGKRVHLKDRDPAATGKYDKEEEAAEKLAKDVRRLAKWQEKLYAQNTHALLLILQGMDTSGKDGIIRHVMAGVNPQGTQVFSFKKPSPEELDHDYLWRSAKALPERGRIGIFNRSYYEEALVVRVHPELLAAEQLGREVPEKKIWKRRFKEMRNFEKYLVHNGIRVLKVFLHISKEEQKRRLLSRIDDPQKNWKFSLGDVTERQHWDAYQHAFESALTHTSTKWAPWYIIPADHKWFARVAVADLVARTLKSLKPHYPELDDEQRKSLRIAREQLEQEPS